MKLVRFALLALAALAAVTAALVAYLALTFDPRDYAPRLAELVKAKTGRTLTIRGDIKLVLWPTLGLTVGEIALSERDRGEVFASVNEARLQAKLAPLLSRRLVVDELHLSGAHVNVVRARDGTLNIDDLLSGEGSLDFDIGRIRLEHSTISYRDLARDVDYTLGDVRLETGRVAHGVVTRVSAAFRLTDSARTIDVAAAVDTRVALDPKEDSYALDDAVLRLNGRLGPIDAIDAVLRGRVERKRAALVASGLSIDAKSQVFERTWTARLTADHMRWTSPIAIADARLEATSPSAPAISVAMDAPHVELDDVLVRANAARAHVVVSQASDRFDVHVEGPAQLDVSRKRITLPRFRAAGTVESAALREKRVDADAEGSATLDGAREELRVALGGRLLASRVEAKLGMTGFRSPAYTFAIDVDAFDADRHLALPSVSAPSTWSVASLSDLPVSGTLRIGRLQSGGTHLKDVKLVIAP